MLPSASGVRHPMETGRHSNWLTRGSWLLAIAGALILASAVVFLAAAVWHVAQLSGYGPTYIVVSPWAAVPVVLASLAVAVGAMLVWRRSVALARRLSLAAIVATVVGWAAFGAAFLVLAGDWGAGGPFG
jgi:hypothetical protein